jgi:hypothetical protein
MITCNVKNYGILICETLLINVKVILVTDLQHQVWPYLNLSSNPTKRKFQKKLLKIHNLKGKKTKKNIMTRTYVRIFVVWTRLTWWLDEEIP